MELSNLLIRKYTSEDQLALIDILRLNIPAFFAREEEKDFVFYLQNEIEDYFVVTIDNSIIGCGGINYDPDSRKGILSWDIIHPDYQGKGVGKQLLKHRINRLLAMKTIEIISVRTSQLVYQFYEKNGFELKEIRLDYWAPGLDMYRMEFNSNLNS